jgi:hypothetical protein
MAPLAHASGAPVGLVIRFLCFDVQAQLERELSDGKSTAGSLKEAIRTRGPNVGPKY